MTPNAVLAVAKFQDLRRAKGSWTLVAISPENGRPLAQVELPGDPLPGGLIVDSEGRIIVSMLDGSLVSYRH